MSKKILIAGISYALFFLFIYAGCSKLMAYNFYLHDLSRSPLLRDHAKSISILIPLLELIIAVALIPEKTKKHALAASVILMLFFTLYIVYVLGFTTDRPCSCGGIIRNLSWPQHLIFNLIFLLLAVLGFALQIKDSGTST